MDVNHYTRIGIVSPQEGFTQPEILQEAKQGVIDDSFKVDKQKVIGLINGQLPSSNPQQEAYRLLLVGACNAYHTQMPFLFPKIDDYTELLMPDDLLSENSILQAVRETLTTEGCQDVEVIGWLYQFYISERKDEVFAALKKNKKIEAKDIPAATQLFTPHWIVRYLVENSLGRLWMLNHPNSRLVEQMEYYIQQEEPETDLLEIASPEEIKVCDPACGSGHMLTYAFDLLYAIYAEEGYNPVQIPSLILQSNLFGIEIDQRAGHLAAFALMVKARDKDHRFFTRMIEPKICILENITFTPGEIEAYKKEVGPDLFTQELWFLLQQFEQAENYGSLIRPQIKNPRQTLKHLDELGVFNDLFLMGTNEKVKKILLFAEYLAPCYLVVLANPPYADSKGLNPDLKKFLNEQYSNVKSNLFSSFLIRIFEFTVNNGYTGSVTPFVWLYLSSYESLRKTIFSKKAIINLVKPSFTSFFASAIVSLVATVIKKGFQNITGDFIDLGYLGSAESQPIKLKFAIDNPDCGYRYKVAPSEFKKIPGAPIAYGSSVKIRDVFDKTISLNEISDVKTGMQTGNNSKFLRYWYEVEFNKITKLTSPKKNKRWQLYSKGGNYRKWYGNIDYVVDWKNEGQEIKNNIVNGVLRSRVRDVDNYYREAISWSFINSLAFGCRYKDPGVFFDVASSSIFSKAIDIYWILGFLNTKITSSFINILNPTANYQIENVSSLPIKNPSNSRVSEIVKNLIEISKNDWNSFELSWGFLSSPIIQKTDHQSFLSKLFSNTREVWRNKVKKYRILEEENNQIFIETYDLEDEFTPEVVLNEITLTCNPHYRYRANKSEKELDALLLIDSIEEFISYAVGCMLGRYSLDKEGLVLANTGEKLEDYLRKVPEPSFIPDEDNVIPVLKGEWFEDDITERFKDFLKITFGVENFEENLAFLEEAIGRDIRNYFVKDFYTKHIKMYKKRPIYWLFSSPKGGFNALIYMHRYTPDTVSVILNDYLVPYRDKLKAHKALQETRVVSPDASQGEKTKASREIDQINKILSELKEYEDEILYPLASQQVEIDLDDGVKINYSKFGKALQKVTGLSEK